jgi:hypothetical protein
MNELEKIDESIIEFILLDKENIDYNNILINQMISNIKMKLDYQMNNNDK